MIRTVGLELNWLPKDIGGLFIKGGFESLEYWYNAVLRKYEK